MVKWALLMAALAIPIAVGYTTIATVEQARLGRGSLTAQVVSRQLWPPRADPEVPQITLQSGSGPIDRGAHQRCRVIENIRADDLEGFMLVSTLSDPRIRVKSSCRFSTAGETPTSYKVHLNNQTLVPAFVFPASRDQAFGTMFYLASSEGLAKPEQKFINAARDNGWNVIATAVEITFAHQQQLILGEEGERSFALRIDNHLADRAYAVESLIGYLQKDRPKLLNRPWVYVGLSAGAIALPTVAARIGPPDAAVLIGGGEDVAQIVLTSPLFREHTTLVQPAESTDDNQPTYHPVTESKSRAQFAANAFRICRIDPSKTARVLQSTPVLMVHAKYDKIVPAHTGDALYESLGQPERWLYRTGHLGLCAMLPLKSRSILKWLEQQVLVKPAQAWLTLPASHGRQGISSNPARPFPGVLCR